jgi:hypothetical protein
MSAMPNMPEPTDFSKQPPLTLNEGFQRPVEEPQVDILDDDEMLKKASMDPRGSRDIAPFGTYQAVEQALESGYYTGLEALDFGTLPDGTPAALFTDKSGQRQAIRMTSERWFAAMQQRAQGRIEMAQTMRRARDAKRLEAPVLQMTKELESYAPGFGEYAMLGLERDPQGTYATVQSFYDRIKANDRAAVREMQKMADGTQLQVAQELADSWAAQTNDDYAMMQRGFIENESIPEEIRAQRVQEIKRWQMNTNRFALLAPPAAGIRRMASFPSYYFSQSNPGALDDLADMAIQKVGYDTVMGISDSQRIPLLVQEAQRLTRNIGWTVPFSAADIDIVSQTLASRLARAPRFQITPPDQLGQRSQFEQAGVRGAVSEMRSGQAQERMASEMQRAKLAREQAGTQRTSAEAQKAAAEAELLRGGGASPTPQASGSATAPALSVQAINRLRDAGIVIPEGVDPLEFLADTADSLKSGGPAEKARLKLIYDIVSTM